MVAFEEEDELVVGKVAVLGRTTLEVILYTGIRASCWNPVTTQSGRQCSKIIKKDSVSEDYYRSTPTGGGLFLASALSTSNLYAMVLLNLGVELGPLLSRILLVSPREHTMVAAAGFQCNIWNP